MEKEKSRRTEDLNDAEIERRVAIAHRMIDVQKELLATHKPVQVERQLLIWGVTKHFIRTGLFSSRGRGELCSFFIYREVSQGFGDKY